MTPPRFHECLNFNKPIRLCFKIWLKKYMTRNIWYKNYQLSHKSLADLEYIINICQEKNIDLYLYISPIHATLLETIELEGIWNILEEWKREIIKMHPVWDFSGYNSITTEAIHDSMKNWHDSAHYSKRVGDLILNHIFSVEEETVPTDFGVLLTSKNLELHLNKIRKDRKKWIVNNSNDVTFLKKIKMEIKSRE